MTTQTEAPKTEAAPAAPASQPAPQPQVDVAKIQADATKAAEAAASKIAGDKLKQIGRALTGESDKAEVNPILEQFLTDPAKILHGVKEIAKKEAKSEINDERKAVEKVQDIQRSVGTKYVNEYPEINTPKKLAAVEAYAIEHERNGKSYEEALELGFKDAVKEFGLTSVTDAQRDGAYRNSGLPGGGGMAPGSPKFNEQKSQNDFISGMRAKASSVRTKK